MQGTQEMENKDSIRVQFRVYPHKDPELFEFLKGMSSASINRLVAVLLQAYFINMAKSQSVATSSKVLTKDIQSQSAVANEKSSAAFEAGRRFERWSRGVHIVLPSNELPA
jgi:hypothetical protein